MNTVIKINQKDNVAVALQSFVKGDVITLEGNKIKLMTDIPKGHKIALVNLNAGDFVYKYGFPIGHATQPIQAGEQIHSHNLKTNLSEVNDYQYDPVTPSHSPDSAVDREISVYRRANGKVGIRNELWVIPTVTCVNGIAERMIEQFKQQWQDHADIDEVIVLKHPYGCSQLGDDHAHTKTILQDLVLHPNAGAVLVVGLGCENNQVAPFQQELEVMPEFNADRVRFMVLQEEQDEIEVGILHLTALYEKMCLDRRVPGRLSELNFGLECGGSDGFSGITANPMLGLFSDYIISLGGTTVLTEVPEMFGAETILMAHAQDEAVFHKTVKMVNDFKQYFIENHQPIYENPSPGNKAGGITTLEEKSLGCTQKAGGSKVIDVLHYADRLKKAGLNLLSAPGNDAVATSALIAAGCQMVLFSTGRGTPYGGVVPTVKISTNTDLALKKPHWIDFDAGALLGGKTMSLILNEFIDYLVKVANGEKTNNEKNKFKDLAILKTGVTL